MYKIYAILNNGETINVRSTIYKSLIQDILQETVYNFLYKENLVLGFFVKINLIKNNYFIVNYGCYKPSINLVDKKEFKKYIKTWI